MIPLLDHLLHVFLPQFLTGMAANFEIAALSLALGLAIGLPLAAARVHGGRLKLVVNALVALLRAAPTFVVMFVILNAIPRDATLFGWSIAPTGFAAVVFSLMPYSVAYVADNGPEALIQWRNGSRAGALLFLPNITRAFFVLVMSSSAGAAVGVPEAIAVILRQAEMLRSVGDKLVLFGLGILCFSLPLQAGFFAVRVVQRRLANLAG